MAILVSIGSRSYTAQRREFQTTLDPGVALVKVRLTRESWPLVNPVLSMGFDYSLDGGGSWVFAGSATFIGGDVLDRFGVPFAEAYVQAGPVPGLGTVGRQLRAFVENFQPLTTAIVVEGF